MSITITSFRNMGIKCSVYSRFNVNSAMCLHARGRVYIHVHVAMFLN
jgi:hypothetical protein